MTQRLIVITGGIGSGKSAVRDELAARGAHVIDADRIGHRILEPDGPAFGPVSERWPEVVVEGAIDRRALGRIVFADGMQLAELEAITHPLITERIELAVAEVPDSPIVAVELPVLKVVRGDEWTKVVVDAPDEVRTVRLSERGLEAAEIAGRMASQPPRDEWLARADLVIDNSGDHADLAAAVDQLVRSLI